MRQSKLKALEIEQAEAKRRSDRNNGLSLMTIRDRGWVRLSNGSLLEWNTKRPMYEGEVRTRVPEGFMLIDGKPYDLDEFRKYERWA